MFATAYLPHLKSAHMPSSLNSVNFMGCCISYTLTIIVCFYWIGVVFCDWTVLLWVDVFADMVE